MRLGEQEQHDECDTSGEGIWQGCAMDECREERAIKNTSRGREVAMSALPLN